MHLVLHTGSRKASTTRRSARRHRRRAQGDGADVPQRLRTDATEPVTPEPVTGYSLANDAEPYDAGHPAVIGWRAATAADNNTSR
jgi:hypothetical protein